MIFASLLLLAGFVVLIKGADLFVYGAAHLARSTGLSPYVVGLTVVAFGTSAPELFVNLPASIVVSEIFLLENGSFLGYETFIASQRVFVMSPWFITLMIYGGLAVLLLYLTINRIKRVARN